MRHVDKKLKTIRMRRYLTVILIISLQFSYGDAFKFQLQQMVFNMVGLCGFGGPCTNNTTPIPSPNDTDRGGRGCIGSLCSSMCSCDFAVCNQGVCVCQENFLPNDDNECIRAVDPSSCLDDTDCQDEKKECLRNFCVCKEDYKFTISNLCIAVLGTMCRDDIDCSYGRNMICMRETCVCDFGYKENNDGLPACTVDQSCTNETCQFSKRDSICVDDNCVCPAGYTEFRGVCAVDSVPVDGDCEFSWQCSDHDPNSECKDTAKCGCIDDYTLVDDVCSMPAACSLGGSCPDDACCQGNTAKSHCDPDSRSCMCDHGYFKHVLNDSSHVCRSMHLLGDPCESDGECQAKTPNSVCYEGHCMCDDTTVKAYQCEPVTILHPDLTTERFTKEFLSDGKVVIKSKFFDTGTYPPNKVFAYSVDGPVGKILKVTIENLVLAEGTTLEIFMSPWKKIAEIQGLVNSHYDNFWFTTYQNCFTVVLISEDARAKGFQISVEVAEKSEGCCSVEYDVTGTAAAKQTIYSAGFPEYTNFPFCHIYLNNVKLTERVFLTLDTFTTDPPPSTPLQPFNYWDSVSTFTSRLVESAEFDTNTRSFMAYPNAGITLVLNNFESTSTSNAKMMLEGEVWTDADDSCVSDVTVSNIATTTTFTSDSSHEACIWKLTTAPEDSDKVLQVTITEFTTTDGEDSVAIYSGELVDDTISPKLGAYDSSVTNKVFDSTDMPTNSMFILLRVADTPNLTTLSFEAVVLS